MGSGLWGWISPGGVRDGLVWFGVVGESRLEGDERMTAADAIAMLTNEVPPGRLGEVV